MPAAMISAGAMALLLTLSDPGVLVATIVVPAAIEVQPECSRQFSDELTVEGRLVR